MTNYVPETLAKHGMQDRHGNMPKEVPAEKTAAPVPNLVHPSDGVQIRLKSGEVVMYSPYMAKKLVARGEAEYVSA